MTYRINYIKMPDGTHLAMRSWKNSNDFNKIILALHGLSVDGAGYGILNDYLSDNHLVLSVDLRGHGASEGEPGNINKYWQYINDLNYIIKNINIEYSNRPLYLLGESIGGTCAINCSLYAMNKIDGLILLAPALKTKIKPRFADIYALFKSYALNQNLNIEASYYKRQLKAKEDFSIKKITPKFILNLWIMMLRAYYTSSSLIKSPVLILQGKKDNIVRFDSVIKFYNRIKYQDKQIKIIENGTHSLLSNNISRDEALFTIDRWIKSH
ncbi:MAG: alpha/beta fold hydrolase [Thermoanaerobacteraceae bacterium]|nr:alpha/beta fold hydrolase [Thermoanaerobacteraceae bacterium]